MSGSDPRADRLSKTLENLLSIDCLKCGKGFQPRHQFNRLCDRCNEENRNASSRAVASKILFGKKSLGGI